MAFQQHRSNLQTLFVSPTVLSHFRPKRLQRPSFLYSRLGEKQLLT